MDPLTFIAINRHDSLEDPTHIHVWKTNLSVSAEEQACCYSLLSAEEKARATRYPHPKRAHWMVSRARLRQLLSHYMGLPPHKMLLKYHVQGKPYIEGSIKFNLSHAHGKAIYGISRHKDVGIDIEYMRDLRFSALIKRYFSEDEQQFFYGLPAAEQRAYFFHAWTVKESVVKAMGHGLHYPLNNIVTEIQPQHHRLMRIDQDAHTAKDWQVHALPMDPGYVAAYAMAPLPTSRESTLLGHKAPINIDTRSK